MDNLVYVSISYRLGLFPTTAVQTLHHTINNKS